MISGLGKTLPCHGVDNFYGVIHHMVVPGLQFTWVRFASEVTKVTPPCPNHLIVYPGGFINALIYIVLVPLEDIPVGGYIHMVLVVGGGGDGG